VESDVNAIFFREESVLFSVVPQRNFSKSTSVTSAIPMQPLSTSEPVPLYMSIFLLFVFPWRQSY